MTEWQSGPRFTKFADLPQELRWMIWEAALPSPRLVYIRQRKLKKTIGEWELETGEQLPILGDEIEGNDKGGDEDGVGSEYSNQDSKPGDAEAGDEARMDDSGSGNAYWQPYGGWSEYTRAGTRADVGRAINAYEYDEDGYKEAYLVGIYSESPRPEIIYVCCEARDVVLHHYTLAFSCAGSVAQTYFDFAEDTLYISSEDFSAYFAPDMLASIIMEFEERFRIEDVENLKRVQRLAVLVDPNDIQPPNSSIQEEFLAQILRHFGGVKHLSLVAKHIESTSVKNSHANISLIEPIDAEKALVNYNSFRANLEQSGFEKLQWPLEPKLDSDFANPKMTEFEHYRRYHCQTDGNVWPMPEICIKAVLASELLDELERGRLDCDAAMARFSDEEIL